MPELPELQAHAERLTGALAGCALAGFEPLSFTALKTFDPPPSKAVGLLLTRVDRRGKHLIMRFGELAFVVHLMQGGRLSFDAKGARKPRGGLARWRFADGRALLLTEHGTEHKAGVWVVAGEVDKVPPLDDLGPEADTVDAAQMAALFAAHSMRLHTFLRDQRILAGIGRRLANEVCWHARLSPFAQTSKLGPPAGVGDPGHDAVDASGPDAAAAVVDAIATAVAEGLAADRARADMSSSKDRPAAVHHRTGQPCPRDATPIRAVEYRDYTVNYCPTCQTGGKILADNTTSKFLK